MTIRWHFPLLWVLRGSDSFHLRSPVHRHLRSGAVATQPLCSCRAMERCCLRQTSSSERKRAERLQGFDLHVGANVSTS